MTTPPPPVVGPGRSSVDRQTLDTSLANVAAGLGEYLSDVSAVTRLAGTLAGITQATLEAAPPDGFGYTTDQAYSIKLFGDQLAELLAGWEGAAFPAHDPSMAEHALGFVGL